MLPYETTQPGDQYRSFGDGWGGGAGGVGGASGGPSYAIQSGPSYGSGGGGGWDDDFSDFGAIGIGAWSDPTPSYGSGYSPSRTSPAGPSFQGTPTKPEDDYWTLSAKAKANRGSGSGGGGRVGGTYFDPRYAIPAPEWKALVAPEAPKFKAVEYTPPEEDPGIARKARAEAAAPGLRASRQAVNEALMLSRNMENPNARGQVTRGALEGYGQSVEGTMSRASSEGRAEAARKRAEQMNIYNSKYQAMSAENMTNYQNQLNKMMMDWGEQQAKRTAEYQTQASAFGRQPPAGQAINYMTRKPPARVAYNNWF